MQNVGDSKMDTGPVINSIRLLSRESEDNADGYKLRKAVVSLLKLTSSNGNSAVTTTKLRSNKHKKGKKTSSEATLPSLGGIELHFTYEKIPKPNGRYAVVFL
jgi:hypothetical protein